MDTSRCTLLVVDDDALVLRTICRQLARSPVLVLTAPSLSDALPILLSGEIDVLLTDLRLHKADGTELLWVAQNNGLKTRCILMSGYASQEDRRMAFDLGAMGILEKPFVEGQLMAAIMRALDPADGFSGDLCCVTLIDVLQMYHLSQRSVVIELAGPKSSRVFMENGRVVHAVHGALTGEEAFRALLSLTHGRLRTVPLSDRPCRTIDRRFDALLLDALRLKDEEQALLRAS